MSEMKIGQQYLITNIKFTHSQYQTVQSGHQRIDDFKVPATVNEIHDWLDEFDHSCNDKIALAIYIRSRLFYYHEMTYDFQLIKELPLPDEYQINVPTFADISDHEYAEYTTATVDITIPTAYIASLSADDIMFADNDIEQALFENMMRNMAIDFNVLTITDHVLELMADYMNEKDASAPNSISEAVYEKLLDLNIDEQTANRISEGSFELSSYLVKDIGQYR